MTTTTPTDVLAALQAAWKAAPTLAVVDPAPLWAPPEPPQSDYCGPHNDPAGWTCAPDKFNRPGYRTVSCRACGKFIGYQPPEFAV